MMTDDQFERFMEKISMRQDDHDTLIAIKTIVASNAKNSEEHKTRFYQEIGNKINNLSTLDDFRGAFKKLARLLRAKRVI